MPPQTRITAGHMAIWLNKTAPAPHAASLSPDTKKKQCMRTPWVGAWPTIFPPEKLG